MQRDCNDRISYVKKCMEKKNKLKLLLKHTEQDMIKEKLLLNKLSEELEKENSDVLKLESSNMTSLFYAILGTKEQKLEKEKQELLKARLKYDQCKNNVDFLAKESKVIMDELNQVEICETEYEDLLNKKLKEINLEDRETSEELKHIIRRKESMNANIIEIDEAIKAGEDALDYIEKTIKELENAQNWGDGDGMIGKIINPSAKYEHVDKAGQYAEYTQRSLGRFKRELSDIKMITGKRIAIGIFDAFSDYFYDGLIFDWVVQSDIGKSLDAVKNTKNHIDKAMSKLYEEKVTEECMIKQLEDQINHIIENA
ncbi:MULTISPECIES: hypothetical protein [unclassified Sedimentibacter]|uniref:hypothetical protein n=1 Tax=unclassified Sedimentibacter TaxID=2649220 RepID=UPI0027DEAFFE|nr:hypothetical protein [Sedimentibacter sp. MB35-C1]WMJ77606.1 hypothetical protein RBQ61_01390 [Sedimentibacter sp. MB35-C1]